MATTSASSSSSSSRRVRVFFITASRPPSSPKQQGVHQDPQEEGVAIEARKKASQRIVASRPPSSPNEQGLDQPILPLLPIRPITGFLKVGSADVVRSANVIKSVEDSDHASSDVDENDGVEG
ncbi:hypothetical protein Syun_013912 [Stephania yunnanensis]|uniref:Uncharacterized protein n=1 Tax=Stephania yunnanensis TaxID=152371 RepID=A0AAP0JKK7_9MAGN